jgi:hypothetical protein
MDKEHEAKAHQLCQKVWHVKKQTELVLGLKARVAKEEAILQKAIRDLYGTAFWWDGWGPSGGNE